MPVPGRIRDDRKGEMRPLMASEIIPKPVTPANTGVRALSRSTGCCGTLAIHIGFQEKRVHHCKNACAKGFHMRIGSPEWNALILEGASVHGVAVSPEQLAAFDAHAQDLLAWNQRTNLTRIVAPEAVAIRHFVDSLALIPHIDGCRTVLDLGAGGGFPGIVVATMKPESRVVLVDAVRKKISFLQYLIRMRGVFNAQAFHSRAEALCCLPQFQRCFDAVVSRAFGDLPATLRAAAPFAGENAHIIAMRGPQGADECNDFMASPDREAVEAILGHGIRVQAAGFDLPREHGRRHLLIFQRVR